MSHAFPAAGDVLVVNNGAAALVLATTALAAGREILVNRGEMVEIGDGFRLPDLIAATGARIREVGATNRTNLRDYQSAVGTETGCILKVHPSNFRIAGFTSSVSLVDLVRRDVPIVMDIGSGLLHPDSLLPDEPNATTCLQDGATVVTASGDKLLGGPQCGLLLGEADVINRLRRHPLARALRVDKLTLAALEATLRSSESPVRTYVHADKRRSECLGRASNRRVGRMMWSTKFNRRMCGATLVFLSLLASACSADDALVPTDSTAPVSPSTASKGRPKALRYPKTYVEACQMQGSCGDQSSSPGDDPATLFRPWPASPAVKDCSTPNIGRAAGSSFGGWVVSGLGPVKVVLTESPPITPTSAAEAGPGPEWGSTKALLVTEREFQGGFLVRGRIVGSVDVGSMAFGEGGTAGWLLAAPGPSLNGTNGERQWPGGLYVRSPGCYELRLDTADSYSVVHLKFLPW